MKKILFLITALIFTSCSVFAVDDSVIKKKKKIQTRINDVGFKILNANKIDKRIIFVYGKEEKKSLLKSADELTKRQIVLYEDDIQYISNEDELAGFLARGISMALKSYGGIWNGGLSAIQVKAAPKIYEIVADKRAVDFMVNAGYNPIGLITYINKAFPQKRFDRFSSTNLTSKRLAIIYEYIYTKYPYYLTNNKYLETDSYQNFLLNSTNNRKLLEEKIKNNLKGDLDYE